MESVRLMLRLTLSLISMVAMVILDMEPHTGDKSIQSKNDKGQWTYFSIA